MEDISPKLLKECREKFDDLYRSSKSISAVTSRIRDGTASIRDASQYSTDVGRILGEVIADTLKLDKLPDEKLYWNIANAVIKPLIHTNYDLVSICSKECQKIAYRNAGIGISVAKSKRNDERIKGLLDDVCASGIDQEQLTFRLQSDIQNISESFYDDFCESNADRADGVGLKTKVVRTVGSSGCCAWCDSLAGIYDYDEVSDKGNEVWQRHTNCSCEISFVTEKSHEKVSNYRKIDRSKRTRK